MVLGALPSIETMAASFWAVVTTLVYLLPAIVYIQYDRGKLDREDLPRATVGWLMLAAAVYRSELLAMLNGVGGEVLILVLGVTKVAFGVWLLKSNQDGEDETDETDAGGRARTTTNDRHVETTTTDRETETTAGGRTTRYVEESDRTDRQVEMETS